MSSSSRDRNKYDRIWRHVTVDQLLQGVPSLLLQCDLSASTSLCLQHEPFSVIFISVTRGEWWHLRHRKTQFSLGATSPCYLMLTIYIKVRFLGQVSKLLYLEKWTDFKPKLNTAALNMLAMGPKKKQRRHRKLALALLLCNERKVQLISEEHLWKGLILTAECQLFFRI